MGYGKRESNSHRRINGVATMLQDIKTRIRGVGFDGDDHGVPCPYRLAGGERRAALYGRQGQNNPGPDSRDHEASMAVAALDLRVQTPRRERTWAVPEGSGRGGNGVNLPTCADPSSNVGKVMGNGFAVGNSL